MRADIDPARGPVVDPIAKPIVKPIIDPVTGFEIPESWIDQCTDRNILDKIRSGRWVLLADGRLLRRGLTTGTTAAAACKGAVLSLLQPRDYVEVPTPAGIRVSMPVKACEGFCIAVKDGGDHQFDVTHGMEIVASACRSEETELVIGKGIGMISALGLCAPRGKPAISQSARWQILEAIEESLEETGIEGTRVDLSVPCGEDLAAETLNPKLGVIGGISILGSTGFVEPWNEHLGESRSGEIKGLKKVVATTGRTGLKFSHILFPDHKAVLIGSKLDLLEFDDDQESVLCGLPALILKWAWPNVLEGTGCGTVAELVERMPDHENIFFALKRAKEKFPFTRIVLPHRDGRIFRDLP
jgi:cobalt-precorrin-5B (C1)-methyltransferase